MRANKIDPTRRNFIKGAAILSAMGATGAAPEMAKLTTRASAPTRKPNVLLICADQFRADFIGAARQNPSSQTKRNHVTPLARRDMVSFPSTFISKDTPYSKFIFHRKL